MKKLLFIMPALPGGGAEKVLIDILKNIDPKRYSLTLLLEYREGVYTLAIPEWVEVKALYKRTNIWLERFHRGLSIIKCYHLFHSLVYRFAFNWLLRGRKFDTIVSFMEGEAVRVHSYLKGKANRNVSWVHIDFSKKHWSLSFFRDKSHEHDCYLSMDRIVFVSEDARRSFLEMYPMDESKSSVLYNLIDRAEIVRLSREKEVGKEKFTICMVGRLNLQKRYDRALDVIKRLKDNGYDVKLRIVGTGELEMPLKSQCEQLEIADMCEFTGFVKPAYPYMKASDIFLSTSEAEGYPLVLCEALCLGLPIVATNITGASEILDNSKYGLLVEEDVDAIYQGVKSLLDNNELREHYALQANERAMSFSVEKIVGEIEKIL